MNQPEHNSKEQKLLEENLELMKKLDKKINRVNKYILWLQIINIIKLIVIVVPIILGFIYLSPLVRETMSANQQFIKIFQNLAP